MRAFALWLLNTLADIAARGASRLPTVERPAIAAARALGNRIYVRVEVTEAG